MTRNAELYKAIAAAKYGRALTSAAIASPLLIWVVGLWLFYARPGLFMAVTVEDGPVESAQVVLIILGAVLAGFAAAFLLRARARPWAMAYAAAVPLLLLIAGEEISWGQRLAGIATPRWFAARNLQGELNLHNLPYAMAIVGGVISAVVFLGLVSAVSLWRRPPEQQAAWRLFLWAPQPALIVAWLSLAGYVVLSTVLFQSSTALAPGIIRRLQEVAELVLMVAGLFFLLAALRGARALAAPRRLSSPLLYTTGLGVIEEKAGAAAEAPLAGMTVSRRQLAITLALTVVAGIGGGVFSAVRPPVRSAPSRQVSPSGMTQLAGWMLGARGGSEAILQDTPDGVLRVEISRAGTTNPGDIQLAHPGLRIDAQQQYRLEFRARSTSARSAFVAVGQNHPPWGDLGLYQRADLTTGWSQFRFDFVGKETDANARISFDLGGGPTVELADVMVRRAPGWEPVPLAAPVTNR
jgi:hypothetical protein